MRTRYVTEKDGHYYAEVDITVEEWKEMLLNSEIFYPEALEMLKYWYAQSDYMATNKEIMDKYCINKAGTPFNGVVICLGKKILRYLNRVEYFYDNKKNSRAYFIIPFEGWEDKVRNKKYFVWKIRDELVQAIEELNIFPDITTIEEDDRETKGIIIENKVEGRIKVSYIKQYERNKVNRRKALEIHGTTCMICGFNFEEVYGPRGRGFIEVHHIKPLSENEQEVLVNPETDLVCVCSNCHSMFHRERYNVPSVEELKKEILKTKLKRK